MDLLNDLLLNSILGYLPLCVLFIPNQLTTVQQSIKAISQFIGDRQPLVKGQPVPFTWTLSQTQNIVTKINILLQEFHDMKVQNQKKQIFNVHKNHPKGIGEENGQDDTHLIYNSASTHPLPDKLNIPRHHAPDPNHTPSTDDNAFMPQKPNPYELWSALPPESLSSSSSDEDSTDDNAACDEYG